MTTIVRANDPWGWASAALTERCSSGPGAALAERRQEDRLRGQVGVQALGAVRAAGAAGAAAAPRGADIRLVQVDAERADPGLPRDVQAALRVAGPDGRGQPEPVVGECHRFGLVTVLDHGRDRAADLLLRDRHPGTDFDEHGRLVE